MALPLPFVWNRVHLINYFFSNLYLQWCQNNLSVDLAFKFAFSWHTEKVFLRLFCAKRFFTFLCSLAGLIRSWRSFYIVS